MKSIDVNTHSNLQSVTVSFEERVDVLFQRLAVLNAVRAGMQIVLELAYEGGRIRATFANAHDFALERVLLRLHVPKLPNQR